MITNSRRKTTTLQPEFTYLSYPYNWQYLLRVGKPSKESPSLFIYNIRSGIALVRGQ